jgi:UDP-N-acetylglucosamine diphosphorylase / glucose-1-phosphate thymidylyltransferase / UDP-N-acetylgalactosamine diphosphorylase / glucosamine-1-phosphate N-acetyltransferase / galactosamine-1-phosphate N-acetyltransferase
VIGWLGDLVLGLLGSLRPELVRISDEIAAHRSHRSAAVASSAVLTGPVILAAGWPVAPGAVLRGGVWAGEDVTIGPHSEIKASLLFAWSAATQRSCASGSIIGRAVNLEAGAVLANHFNERADKQISMRIDGQVVATGLTKFGALIGDGSRIGANAVAASRPRPAPRSSSRSSARPVIAAPADTTAPASASTPARNRPAIRANTTSNPAPPRRKV